jgi:altronate dehydratase large subunit
VGLGCEFLTSDHLLQEIGKSGKRVEAITIQAEGGSQKCTRRGVEIARSLVAEAATIEREEFEWSKVTMGLECGGSDSMSGVTANPMVGVAADWLVSEGGTAIFSETTEMIGTEKLLSQRAATEEVSKKILDLIARQRKLAEDTLGPFADLTISPGNVEGGLSTIQEKSLGCVIKGGTSAIQAVLDYGEVATKRGLAIMDTPGSDIFSVTGMVAGGAQIIVFTTGRGTPVGFPIAPVIKIASNSELFEMMNEDMDMNAGQILEGLSVEDAGAGLIDVLKNVANGEMTKAEINRQDVLSIHTVGPAF